MTASLAQIWRHPVKGVGAERLEHVELTPNRPLPFDRFWAILEAGGEDGDGWRACRNFIRGAKGPSLMAVVAETLEDGRISFSHPDCPPLTVDMGAKPEELIEWLLPIYPASRPRPVKVTTAPPEGMSDANFPSVSILGLSSLRALSQKLGQELDPRRFRGNLWIDGLGPWEEFEWVGRRLKVGDAELDVIERIGRCRATEANPATGRRDANTLRALEDGWGHTDFGVYAQVTRGGRVAELDPVVLA